MFKSHLAIAIRHILKHKGHALINILGLAIGITCCVRRFPEYKQRLRRHPGIGSVGASGLAPGRLTAIGTSLYQSDEVANGERIELGTTGADEDFAAPFGIEMTAGRFFSRAFGEGK